MMNTDVTKLLAIFNKKAGKYRDELFRPFMLKSVHYSYLRTVYHQPGLSQDGIASVVYSDKGNVARQLQYLSKLGYIEIKKDLNDARKHGVYMTETGNKVFELMMKLENEYGKFITEGISEPELAVFGKVLSSMIENISKKEEI